MGDPGAVVAERKGEGVGAVEPAAADKNGGRHNTLVRRPRRPVDLEASSYEAIKELRPEGFKRLTGVPPGVFGQMIGVLREAETRKQKSGRPSKLSLEDKLLLAMSYWREYRTQVHIAASYG